jgi:hypothetical protein
VTRIGTRIKKPKRKRIFSIRKILGKDVNDVVVVSDTHCGCGLALCPPDGVPLDDGGSYQPSEFQKKLWAHWEYFWGEFVPEATRGNPYAVIFNGDAIDGVHHNSTTQISHNLTTQGNIAHRVLKPLVDLSEGRYYHIRGTEAHVGKSAAEEELLAQRLEAKPNQEGQYARYDIWKSVGPKLIHALHHIGTTGSQAYESTAVHKELVESYTEAARWGERPPDVIVRSHRHRNIETRIPVTELGVDDGSGTAHAIAVVTPAWQGKTPFVWKIPGGRLAQPQFGGIVIRWHERQLFTRHQVWSPKRSPVE